jgi:surfeit locus 1 family protein
LLTPLVISPDLPWLWVDQGFILKDKDIHLKEQLENVSLEGTIYYPSRVGFILGDNLHHREDQWYIQRIDLAALATQFQQPVYPFVLLLNPPQQIETMPPSKHLGYAVQWFALALTLMILYIGIHLKRTHHDKQP